MKILLIVIAVIIAFLLIPVTVSGGYDIQPALEIKYLFYKKTVFPKPEKTEGGTAKKKAKPAKAAKHKKKFPLTVGDMIELLPKAVDRLIPPVRKLLKRTVVGKFSLSMTVVGSDAADTAIKFGKINGAVFYAVALLDRIMTLKVKNVDIIPGFAAEQSEFKASATMKAYPLALLIAAIQLGISALILLIPAIKERKRKNRAANAASTQINDRKDDRNGEEKSVGRSA